MSYAVRFALGIFCGLLLSVIAWAVLYASSFGFRSTPNAHYIANWFEQKANIAARTASPRIVIAGGSNAFYGLSAKRISETLGVQAVNYATQGGLLLDYHLYKLRQILRPGDLLILPLEFEFYDADERPLDVCIEYVLGADPAYLRTLRFDQTVFWFLAPPSGLLAKRLFTSRAIYQETLQRVANQMKDFMNAFGDRAGHSSASMTESDKQFIRSFPAHDFPKRGDCLRAEHPWRHLRDFSAWCKAHQITILAAYPNTIDDPSFHTDLGRRNLARIRKRFASIGVPMVGKGREALRPREDFYDTEYHLTEEGQKKRTDDFIILLHPFLEKWQASIPSRDTQSRPPSTLRKIVAKCHDGARANAEINFRNGGSAEGSLATRPGPSESAHRRAFVGKDVLARGENRASPFRSLLFSDFVIEQAILSNDDQPIRLDRTAVPGDVGRQISDGIKFVLIYRDQ